MTVAHYSVTFDINTAADWPGYELATASYVGLTTATAPADVPGMQVTFVAGTRPLAVTLEAMLTDDTAGQEVRALILLDGTQIGFIAYTPTVANRWGTLSRTVRLPQMPAGSTHTIRVQVGRSGSTGTAMFGGDVQSPSSLTVITR